MSFQKEDCDTLKPQTDLEASKPEENDLFNHLDNDELNGPKLPSSIYSSCIISALGFSAKDLCSCDSLYIILPQWITVIANYIVSLTIIYYLREIRDATPFCDADLYLQYIGVIIFCVYNVGEMIETMFMFIWVTQQFKTTNDHEQMVLAGGEDAKIVSGMTMCYKTFVCCFLLVPKLLLGLALSYYGSGFVFTSDDNESLLLNCVALTFITQVDDLAYIACVPDSIKAQIDKCPAVQLTHDQKKLAFMRPYIIFVSISLIAYLSHNYTCLDHDESIHH